MSAPKLTEAQRKVLAIAERDGGSICAGKSEHKGHVEHHESAAILACARRGWMTLQTNDTTTGVLTDAGRAALRGES